MWQDTWVVGQLCILELHLLKTDTGYAADGLDLAWAEFLKAGLLTLL